MKKGKLYILLSLLSITLAGCGEPTENTDNPVITPTPNPIVDPTPDPDPPVETKVEKKKLAYTYRDVNANYYKASNTIPNEGEPNLLILPIYFNDSSSFIPEDKKSVVKSDIEKAFFGSKEEVGFESVASYYTTLSQGKCNLKGTVSDWIEIEESYINYAFTDRSTLTLVKEATTSYFLLTGDDRNKYDLDKNGYLDGVILIYAAPDSDNIAEQGSSYSNLWAYTNWLDEKPNVDNPCPCNFFWASYDFLYSPAKANSILGNSYGGGDDGNEKLLIDTHVYIHEIGHMFGLQDYYDYSYQFSPAGGYSMQDYNVGSHDPFSVMSLGWCNPYIPTKSCTITLNKFQSSRDCIILSNSWNAIDSPFDEYLVVEFYSPDGLNQFDHDTAYFSNHKKKKRPTGPDECGIRLWHVDARLLASPHLRDPGKITVDPNADGKVMHAMSNTYSHKDYGKSYVSVLGSSYANFNILQLIRNEETETYQSHNTFDKYSLFKDGSKFSMNSFGRQFVNKARLNSNKVLGWTFTVSIKDDQAEITLTRTI